MKFLRVNERKGLTVEEKALSYSKYYYMEMAKPDQAMVDRVNQGPIDPKDALRIQDLNDLLNPGYLASEFGYCVMPDGSGYISNITKMPGVTPEMFDWWFLWHGLHPLRYKVWDPDDHFDVRVSDEDRRRLLDPNIPMRERIWGVKHYIKEDVGLGHVFEPIADFQSPEEFGFDMKRFKSPNVETAICAGGFMCHFIRKIERGVELRSRFWLGWTVVDKKPVRIEGAEWPESDVKGATLHNIKEFTNLAKILPLIYAEESGKLE